ncbi:hypothetical protein DAEQUDRAFT_556239 [Daedalea quercina L-15889]|uniref:Uncharacterized protein n=1 Tax=Daedalea quercina L-15889 TaxID=1314783 RepID=A0A165T5K2_9APHY|nr:hypothetical protein DAEQUDRAFT_556239 [Daedalea quercina L-15889]
MACRTCGIPLQRGPLMNQTMHAWRPRPGGYGVPFSSPLRPLALPVPASDLELVRLALSMRAYRDLVANWLPISHCAVRALARRLELSSPAIKQSPRFSRPPPRNSSPSQQTNSQAIGEMERSDVAYSLGLGSAGSLTAPCCAILALCYEFLN